MLHDLCRMQLLVEMAGDEILNAHAFMVGDRPMIYVSDEDRRVLIYGTNCSGETVKAMAADQDASRALVKPDFWEAANHLGGLGTASRHRSFRLLGGNIDGWK